MTTFVLVHGAFGGSYGFRVVRKLLHERGHEVTAPSLTGIGERSHLTGPRVDLSLHIEDACNHVLYEDLTDITLVGFSYGGMVVTGMVDRIRDRITKLVYLDAMVPSNGQAVIDVIPMALAADELDSPWSLAPVPRELDTPEATAWSNARRVDQPLRTFTDPVSLSTPLEELGIALAYIKATADPAEPDESAFWKSARHAQASPAWSYYEIGTNHMVPLNRPEELAAVLEDIG